jgi:hypothetical protein
MSHMFLSFFLFFFFNYGYFGKINVKKKFNWPLPLFLIYILFFIHVQYGVVLVSFQQLLLLQNKITKCYTCSVT